MLLVNLFSRKIFLEFLGDTLNGLTTTMQFTIGLLNMADIGIVTAISCALFQPVFNNDKEEINRIISLFCFLFRIVGFVIIGIGMIILFFLPMWVKEEVPTPILVVSFLTFLFTTSLSYFVNYKQQLLLASQKTYIVTRIQNSVIILKISGTGILNMVGDRSRFCRSILRRSRMESTQRVPLAAPLLRIREKNQAGIQIHIQKPQTDRIA